MSTYELKVLNNSDDLAREAALIISNLIKSVLQKKERCHIALSGGSTPCKTYHILKDQILPWEKVDIFLGDERWVPSNHKDSNALMLKNSLLSSGLATKARFYEVPVDKCLTPAECAVEFSLLIETVCGDSFPLFDLTLLGLGDDGHTASLFPQSDSLNVKESITTVSAGKGTDRITLTAPCINASSKIIFLVSGKGKKIALQRLLDPNEKSSRTPAKLIDPASNILILADKDSVE